ncbi:MAG TPA: hypothetical protein PKA42_01160 [Candidatus Paceibacterota bacterium]|nr:hypothetical protein [Candidatus Paceibacterota bacterium]HMO82752.1 hypothetical protein [Candidatus Paceibacterota bacterium]
MKTKALITSCSNKFFPSIINLLTSIKVNYPEHPPIYVYDLGLFYTFRQELKKIEGVTVISMPKFCPHWRSCYTWKTYIFAHPLADLNLYLDAGCQVLQPLDKDFKIIEEEKVLLVDQEQLFSDIVPKSYKEIFSLSDDHDNKTVIHAGIIGFLDSPEVNKIFYKIYAAALTGLALGFSINDSWRNKGKDKNIFIRDCRLFRHDLTLVNIFFRKYWNNIHIRSLKIYHGNLLNTPEQRIWHIRLNWKRPPFMSPLKLHSKRNFIVYFNRLVVLLLISLRRIVHIFKGI